MKTTPGHRPRLAEKSSTRRTAERVTSKRKTAAAAPGATSETRRARAASEARQLLAELRPRIIEQLTTLIASGRSLRDIGIEHVASRMTATLPSPLPWDEQVGPFYTTPRVTQLLRCSRQAVNDRVHRSTLLALRTRDDVLVYPIWQFDGDHVMPGLAEILAIFRGSSVDPWLLASWLRAPQEALGNRSVIDWYAAGYGSTPALDLARAAKSRWVE